MNRTVTVIHPGSLGDVLLSLPALRALRAAFPAHGLGLVASGEVGCLLLACGEIDTLFPLERDTLAVLLAGQASQASVGEGLCGWLGRGDVAVCWMSDPEQRLSSALQGLGIERIVIRSPLSSDCEAVHQADRFLETVQTLASVESHHDRLRLPEKVLKDGKARLDEVGGYGERPVVVVHPGSGSRHKCSVSSLLAHAIERLQSAGAAPVLVVGPADDERLAEVSEACAIPPPAFQALPLLPVAGLLAHVNLFLGHDSGLMHLAAALQIPTIALFGPTDRQRWAPRGGHVTVLSGAPCLCRGQGWQAVQLCRDKPCLQVPPEALVETCLQALQRQGSPL